MEKNRINTTLIKRIEPYYDKELYNDVLRTSCMFLCDIIREKSDSDKDGEKLIQEVFLGVNPKIIINKFLTQSEKDEQRGFGLIIQGLICSIRNPLSHELDYNFSKKECDIIISLVNDYIFPKINDSTGFSYVDNWEQFINDSNFVQEDNYINLILEKMSQLQRYETAMAIFNNYDFLKSNNRKKTLQLLIKSLNKKYFIQIIQFLNKILLSSSTEKDLVVIISNLPAFLWKDLDDIVTLRIENMFFKSISEGSNDENDLFSELFGFLGINISNDLLEQFSNKEKILDLLKRKLDINVGQGIYVIRYFKYIIDVNNVITEEKAREELKNGNINYYNLFKDNKEYKNEIKNFKEKDELPLAFLA